MSWSGSVVQKRRLPRRAKVSAGSASTSHTPTYSASTRPNLMRPRTARAWNPPMSPAPMMPTFTFATASGPPGERAGREGHAQAPVRQNGDDIDVAEEGGVHAAQGGGDPLLVGVLPEAGHGQGPDHAPLCQAEALVGGGQALPQEPPQVRAVGGVEGRRAAQDDRPLEPVQG